MKTCIAPSYNVCLTLQDTFNRCWEYPASLTVSQHVHKATGESGVLNGPSVSGHNELTEACALTRERERNKNNTDTWESNIPTASARSARCPEELRASERRAAHAILPTTDAVIQSRLRTPDGDICKSESERSVVPWNIQGREREDDA